jgi:hypothetical protein
VAGKGSRSHGEPDTMMKYYTGVLADLQKRAAEALGEPLFGLRMVRSKPYSRHARKSWLE